MINSYSTQITRNYKERGVGLRKRGREGGEREEGWRRGRSFLEKAQLAVKPGATCLPQTLDLHFIEFWLAANGPIIAGELPLFPVVGLAEPLGLVLDPPLLLGQSPFPLRLFQLQFWRFSAGNVAFFQQALVRSEPAIRGWKQRDQTGLEVVELDGKARETIVEFVVFRQGARTPHTSGRWSHSAVKSLAPFTFAIKHGNHNNVIIWIHLQYIK